MTYCAAGAGYTDYKVTNADIEAFLTDLIPVLQPRPEQIRRRKPAPDTR
jgi:hypothetical protein